MEGDGSTQGCHPSPGKAVCSGGSQSLNNGNVDRGDDEFAAEVYALTSQVPRGKVTTYGAIAKALGKPGASRAVGAILGANPNPIVVPCHRVVMSTGSLGGYSSPRGPSFKAELLKNEGVEIVDGRIDLGRFGFVDFFTGSMDTRTTGVSVGGYDRRPGAETESTAPSP